MKFSYYFGLLIICAIYYIQANDILRPFITVSGTGEVKVEPTQALINIGFELHNKDIDGFPSQVDKKASDIIAYLKEKGIDAKYIHTLDITIYPHYPDDNSGNANPDYFVAQKSMIFVLKEITNYESIISELYYLDLNTINGITFQVEDETISRIESKRKAVENAKEVAQAMAEELGVEIGNVYSVTESYYSEPTFDQTEMVDNKFSSPNPSISGGEMIFSADVNVVFYIIQ